MTKEKLPSREETYLKIINVIYNKPIVKITLNEYKLRAFSLKSGRRQGYLLSSLLVDIVLEVLAITISQDKDKIGKEKMNSEYPYLQMI